MAGHHVIISGTGRNGTTFLVQLMTELRLPTGFSNPRAEIFPNCNAGMEWDIARQDAPYIVKAPQLCDHLDRLIMSGTVVIDCAIIPVRNLRDAAQSRIEVSRKADPTFMTPGVPGGLWGTNDPNLQATVLAHKFFNIMDAIARHDIPVTLLSHPKLLQEPEYLYAKLKSALVNTKIGSRVGSISKDVFRRAYDAVYQEPGK